MNRPVTRYDCPDDHCLVPDKDGFFVWHGDYEELKRQRDELLSVLETTAGNIRSLRTACTCITYDVWLQVVEEAIAKAKGGQS